MVAYVMRRISGGLYRRVAESAIHDWRKVEFLRGIPQEVKSGASYKATGPNPAGAAGIGTSAMWMVPAPRYMK